MTDRAKRLTAGATALASICAGVIIGVAPAQGADQWTVQGPTRTTSAAAQKDLSNTRNRCTERPMGRVLRSGVEGFGLIDGPSNFRAWATCIAGQTAN